MLKYMMPPRGTEEAGERPAPLGQVADLSGAGQVGQAKGNKPGGQEAREDLPEGVAGPGMTDQL
jgi:hypothetical protein